MTRFLKSLFHPATLITFYCVYLFWELFFLGKIPLPADTLVGSYFPWLDYKWGYVVGVPVKNSPISDAFSNFFPWKYLAIDLLKQGTIPLWNKYAFTGTPLLASYHSAVFFPANLLLLLPRYFGWGLYVFGSTLTAALSFYLYIKRHISSKAARFGGSVIFATSGLMTTWVEFGTSVWAMALIPILLYCLDQFFLEKRPKYLSGFSLILAFLILAGNVQVDIYSVLLVVLYGVFLRLRFSKQVRTIDLLVIAPSVLIGVGLAAFQLLPSLMYFKTSIRSVENFAKNFNYGLIPFYEMIRLWVADFFGHPATKNYFGRLDYHEMSPYLGAITLPLISPLLMSRFRSSPLAGFFMGVFIISVFTVISNPLSKLIFSQPLPLLTYSYASRLLFVISFAAAVLGSLALDQLHRRQDYLIWLRYFSVLFLSITLIAIAATVDKTHQLIALRNSLIPVAILLFIGVVTFFKKVNRRILITIFVLILALDLGRYFKKHNPFVPPGIVFPETPIITYLQSQKKPMRIAREMGPLLPPNSWVHFRLESIEGYDPLQLLDYSRLFRVVSADQYDDEVSRFSQIIDKANPSYLDALNVNYFLALKPDQERKTSPLVNQLIKRGYHDVFEDGSVIIYQNPDSLDRAYFINRLRFVEDKSGMGAVLDDPAFNPADEAIVIGQPFSFKPGKYEVLSLNHTDNKVEISVKTDSEGFLVLADAFDTGWKSYLNDEENKIYQVNGALRGVRIPPGNSQVIFKYQPPAFKNGVIISMFSVLALLLFQVSLHLLKRR